MKTFRSGVKMLLGTSALVGFALSPAFAADYYLSPTGNDLASGQSVAMAWKTLKRASQEKYGHGDRIFLQSGATFAGMLHLKDSSGNTTTPITISSTNPKNPAIIDARGESAAVWLEGCSHVVVRALSLTNDWGKLAGSSDPVPCYGVLVSENGAPIQDTTLDHLVVHGIYAENQKGTEVKKKHRHAKGCAILFRTDVGGVAMSGITVSHCEIYHTQSYGMKFAGHGGPVKGGGIIENIKVFGCKLTDIGGPGIQGSGMNNCHVYNNVIDGTGSKHDPRNHGRGSGFWCVASTNVLVEHNRLMNARGGGDSCGAHIDYLNSNVVYQYNLSYDNEGGFVEILGASHDCSYRYNISVNDGWRKGVAAGIVRFGNYVKTGKRQSPYDIYIYNNTVIKADGSPARFFLKDNTKATLIANNIFYIVPPSVITGGKDKMGQNKNGLTDSLKNLCVTHNLFSSVKILNTWPKNYPKPDPIVGDPEFLGDQIGFSKADLAKWSLVAFTPKNTALVKGKGIVIKKLPGDSKGLSIGLSVKTDILGNPVNNQYPGLGAISVK